LVIIGVRLDGAKELVSIGDGMRESKLSWLELLRDLKARRLSRKQKNPGAGFRGADRIAQLMDGVLFKDGVSVQQEQQKHAA